MVWGLSSFRWLFPRPALWAIVSHTFIMGKELGTKNEILRKTYQLMFTYNCESITIEQIEKATGRTRGAIFYFFRDKHELFNDVIDSFFFSVFNSIDNLEIAGWRTDSSLWDFYSTPFERVRNIIQMDFGEPHADKALLNIMSQGVKVYAGFCAKMNAALEHEKSMLTDYSNTIGKPVSEDEIRNFFVKQLGEIFAKAYDLQVVYKANN